MAIESINPATGELLRRFEEYTPQEVERIVAQVFAAFASWRETSFAQRAELVRRAGALLRERKAQYGRLITLEMGKPIAEAEAEVEKCAWNCDFYAENAERLLAEEHVATNAAESYVEFEP